MCPPAETGIPIEGIVKSAKSVREASDVVLKQYERPADQGTAVQEKRAAYGQKYFDKYAGKQSAPAKTETDDGVPFKVKVSIPDLNIRKGPGLASVPAQPSENKPREKSCQMCGKPFMQYPGCREKKFCSAECRNKFWNIHIGDEKRKKMETYTCPNCGKTFYAYPGKLRKYCSHGCYIESRFGGAVCV